jgi:hypothetical protein
MDNPVQRHLYLNTLAQYGVSSPTEGNWETRAAQFWSHGSLVNGEDANVRDATPVNKTACSLASRHDASASRTKVAWSPMRIPLEGSFRRVNQVTAGSEPMGLQEALPEDCDDDSPLQSSELTLSLRIHGNSPIAPLDQLGVVDEPYKAEDCHQEADIVAQVICTRPAEYGDAAQ